MSKLHRSKIIQDSVHGMIEIEPLANLIIDTPVFQRLRSLRQLGLCFFVYPSCHHTRFEHSVGTYHLARKLLDAIQRDPAFDGPEITKEEAMAVRLAALCHDLGHGPFSHVWESFVREGGPNFAEYKHELLSVRILKYIVQTSPEVRTCMESSGVDLNLVIALMLGDPEYASDSTSKSMKKTFLFEILSNSANGMDVDKWDYLLRDCLHAGLGQGSVAIDLDRFLRFYRPAPYSDPQNANQTEVEWHLAFRDTELESVLRTFKLRQHLHQILYQHKTVTGLNGMLHDLLHLLEPMLGLRNTSLLALQSNKDSDLENFLQLHDSLLWDIYHGRPFFHDTPRGTNAEAWDEAKHLASRIFTRKLYTYVESIFEVRSAKVGENSAKTRSPEQLNGIHEPFLAEMLPPDSFILKHLGYTTPDITAQKIRDQIFACLPEDSAVKDVNMLLVAKSSFTSNSTPQAPRFYFYTRTGKTFVYEEPLRIVQAYRLYWRGPFCEDVIRQLNEACDKWYHNQTQKDRTK